MLGVLLYRLRRTRLGRWVKPRCYHGALLTAQGCRRCQLDASKRAIAGMES